MTYAAEKTSTISQIAGCNTRYINALNDRSSTSVAIGVLLTHTRTGEEIDLDIIAEDDRLWRVLAIVREHFNSCWAVSETWSIEPMTVIEQPIAA